MLFEAGRRCKTVGSLLEGFGNSVGVFLGGQDNGQVAHIIVLG